MNNNKKEIQEKIVGSMSQESMLLTRELKQRLCNCIIG